ncbi:serine/threonine-protein kinase DDB_G0283821 [Lucilia cuprina]|uniref:serine/threonine-protein kinase DDB_G0283821 n=1 Tax=Lucilia cuprina TaxID=7375 RepID=UPI001F06FD5E|nr:serine/threonine-protein kinase DDB_G0283821 [Lucilia cuprina]
MNRSNSFVSALKWWPLQGHLNQTHNNGNTGDGGGGGGGGTVNVGHHQNPSHNSSSGGGLGFRGLIPFNRTSTAQTFGSSVAVQKLRESKWFKPDEQRIFCAVVECGFIVEVRSSAAVARKLAQQQQRRRQRLLSLTNKTRQQNNSGSSSSSSNDSYEHEDVEEFCKHHQTSVQMLLSSNGSYRNNHNHNHHHDVVDDNYDVDDDDDDDLDSQDENNTPITTWFGVVLCKTNKDNKPKPETIEIFSVKIRENGTFKMIKMSLDDIWNNDWELRINNFADKEKPPHNEKDIRNQISFARKAKQSLWNNNKHFVYWCRYGSRQQDVRKRQMSECVKWGSVGMNAGMLLLMNKQKSYSTSK